MKLPGLVAAYPVIVAAGATTAGVAWLKGLAVVGTFTGSVKLRHLRSDNGPEFVATAIIKWAVELGIDTAHISPGKPWENGTEESFNGKFRDECLSLEWFRARPEAVAVIELWRQHYNQVRPHSSLGYKTPHEFKQHEEQMAVQPAGGASL